MSGHAPAPPSGPHAQPPADGPASGHPHHRPSAPCRFRITLAASLGAYPVITLILYLLGPATEGWAVWQKTLAIVPVMVPAMVFGIIPAVHRFAGPWLRPRVRA